MVGAFCAPRLLANTDLTVKEIAVQLGYDDQSYFVRFFKIQTEKSPIELEKYKAKTKEWAKCPIQCAQYPLYEILRAGNFVL